MKYSLNHILKFQLLYKVCRNDGEINTLTNNECVKCGTTDFDEEPESVVSAVNAMVEVFEGLGQSRDTALTNFIETD